MKTAVLLLTILAAAPAHATTITWDLTIDHIRDWSTASTIFEQGEQVTVSASFDLKSGYQTIYNDGENGIAEFGSGDDTVYDIHYLADNPRYTAFSNVDFTFSDSLNEYFKTTEASHDQHDVNRSALFDDRGNWVFYRFGDDSVVSIRMANHDDQNYEYLGADYFSIGEATDDPDAYYQVLNFAVNSVKITEDHCGHHHGHGHQPVPEPSTMLLFGGGLAGMALRKFIP